MSFNIGDRVHPISDSDFDQFGEGTIVSKYDMGGYYINWDNANDHTYPYTFRDNGIARTYDNVYMLFDDRFELVDVNIAINKPPLPSDPRLRGICLKIRELDRKFKQRQEAKKDIPFEEAAQRAYYAYTTASGTFGTTIAQVEEQPVQYTPMYLNTVRTTY
jgi:hypothetical protein